VSVTLRAPTRFSRLCEARADDASNAKIPDRCVTRAATLNSRRLRFSASSRRVFEEPAAGIEI
jgi:hypothetical protein